MYQSFFGFTERPFTPAALAKRYFPGQAIETARQTLARCIDRAEGVGLLTGPAGTGKTLLCQVLAEQFRPSLQVALLASGRLCTRQALLQAIHFELGLPYRDLEEGDLRLSLVDQLSPRGKSGDSSNPSQLSTAALLLIVDEAHTLPLRLLEELRLITNLVRGGQPRVRLVLAGGPQLEERFASPKLESFNQRVAARSCLEALDRLQTVDYVRHQIRQAGAEADAIFTADALEAIAQATDGIPRLINQVCDHVLLLAYAGGERQITAEGIEEAWADLQQLPTPWNATSGSPASEGEESAVVEFGSLDDELIDELADELPAALPFRAPAADASPRHTLQEHILSPHMQPQPEQLEQPEPLDNLRRITAQLAEINDDFQPAGSVEPQVELALSNSLNPFHEAFDEEEVVIDRYTSLEIDALAHRPLVRSAESRELAAILAAADTTVEQPSMAIAPATWPGGVPTQSQQPQTEQPPPEVAPQFCSSCDAAEPADALSDALPVAQKQSPAGPDATYPPASPTVVSEALQAASNDDDLIVIEEPPEMKSSASKKPTPRVRRQEYRQLFAQLRRG